MSVIKKKLNSKPIVVEKAEHHRLKQSVCLSISKTSVTGAASIAA